MEEMEILNKVLSNEEISAMSMHQVLEYTKLEDQRSDSSFDLSADGFAPFAKIMQAAQTSNQADKDN